MNITGLVSNSTECCPSIGVLQSLSSEDFHLVIFIFICKWLQKYKAQVHQAHEQLQIPNRPVQILQLLEEPQDLLISYFGIAFRPPDLSPVYGLQSTIYFLPLKVLYSLLWNQDFKYFSWTWEAECFCGLRLTEFLPNVKSKLNLNILQNMEMYR